MRDAAHYHQKAKESAYKVISEETEIFKWFDESFERYDKGKPYMFFSDTKDIEKIDPIWEHSDQLNTLGFFVVRDESNDGTLVFYGLAQEAIELMTHK